MNTKITGGFWRKFMKHLPAKGLGLNFGNVGSEEAAKEILKRISSWRR